MTTIQKLESNMARNNALDRIMQGVAATALVALAAQDLVERYIRMPYPFGYIMTGGIVAFIIYCVLAPLFRR